MATTKKYIVGFTRSCQVGREEYDAGTTLAEARKELAFFKKHLPADVRVELYYYEGGYDYSARREVRV